MTLTSGSHSDERVNHISLLLTAWASTWPPPVLRPKSYHGHERWSRRSEEKATEWNCLIYGSIPSTSPHHYRNIASKTHLSTTRRSDIIKPLLLCEELRFKRVNNHVFSVKHEDIRESMEALTHGSYSNDVILEIYGNFLKIMCLDSLLCSCVEEGFGIFRSPEGNKEVRWSDLHVAIRLIAPLQKKVK